MSPSVKSPALKCPMPDGLRQNTQKHVQKAETPNVRRTATANGAVSIAVPVTTTGTGTACDSRCL